MKADYKNAAAPGERGADGKTVSTTASKFTAEVALRLEAIAGNSASALLGQLPTNAVLAGNVSLADRAMLFLRVALEEAAL